MRDNKNSKNTSDVSEKIRRNGLAQEDIDKLYDIIELTHKILIKHNIKYTISGGTLLGAVRHKGLIPWDNDADFDVMAADLPKIQQLSGEFEKYGLELIRTVGWGLQVTHENSPVLKTNNPWGSKWPFLDLIALKLENGKYYLAEEEARGDYPDYYLTLVDWNRPFDDVPFGHLTIKSIQNKYAYLDRVYGTDQNRNWRSLVEINMNHRDNYYYENPLVEEIKTFAHARHSTKSKIDT